MRIAARDSVSMRTWNRINNELKAHYQDVINQKKSAAISEIGVA
jgi:phosphatidylinositol alpha 1,6-mannosyltransferase